MISFLREIVEHGGFYRTSDQAWVTMERIQFVGACNPPTDPGRKPLSHRLVLVSLPLYSFTQLCGVHDIAVVSDYGNGYCTKLN